MGRSARRLSLVVIAGAALVALAVPLLMRFAGLELHLAFAGVLVLLALAAILYIAFAIDPAWPISVGIGLSIFSGLWGEMGVPGLVPDRMLIALGILSLLLRTRSRRAVGLKVEPVHIALALATVYVIASATWVDSLRDPEAYFGLLDRFGLVPFLMFVLAPVAFAAERQRRILLGTLVVVGLYLGLTALFETLGLDALVFPKYILDPSVGYHIDRARGPFVEAVANGLMLYICAVAAFMAAAMRRRGSRALPGFVLVLCLAGTLFTLTRSIWLAAVVATAVAMIATPSLRRYILPTAVIGTLLVFGALLLVPGLATSAGERQGADLPVWDRINSNNAALRMLADHPLLGVGWNRFDEESRPYFRQNEDIPLTGVGLDVHNVFLSHAVELGLLGAGLWLLAFLLAIGSGIFGVVRPELRPWQSGLIAVAVAWIVVANLGPLGYAPPNLLLWTWAGIVYGGRRSAVGAGWNRRWRKSRVEARLRISRPVELVVGEDPPFWWSSTTETIERDRLTIVDPEDLLDADDHLVVTLWIAPGDSVTARGRFIAATPGSKEVQLVGMSESDEARLAAFLAEANRQAIRPASRRRGGAVSSGGRDSL